MIEIKVDKESEIIWLKNVFEGGVLNAREPFIMNFLGIPATQEIHYILNANFEDDIKEKRDEYNNRFANKKITIGEIEEILRKEYYEQKK